MSDLIDRVVEARQANRGDGIDQYGRTMTDRLYAALVCLRRCPGEAAARERADRALTEYEQDRQRNRED